MTELNSDHDHEFFEDSSSYEKLLSLQSIQVDKSRFIKKCLRSLHECHVILRPPGFGKSTNLRMLGYYCSRKIDEAAAQKTFGKLEIASDHDLWMRHRGKYEVVSMSLKDCVGTNWPEMRKRIEVALAKAVKPHLETIQTAITESKRVFYLLRNYEGLSNSRLSMILFELVYLLKVATSRKVLVLMDDYDVPWRYPMGTCNDETSRDFFFRSFFSLTFKDNHDLSRACFMGLFGISGFQIPGLLWSVEDNRFHDCFGFTKEELFSLQSRGLQISDDKILEIWKWAGGYYFDSSVVVCPRSFHLYVGNCFKTVPNWKRPGELDVLKHIIRGKPLLRLELLKCIEVLLKPEKSSAYYKIDRFKEKVEFKFEPYLADLLCYLCMLGYLTYLPIARLEAETVTKFLEPRLPSCMLMMFLDDLRDDMGVVRIPNRALVKEWVRTREELALLR